MRAFSTKVGARMRVLKCTTNTMEGVGGGVGWLIRLKMVTSYRGDVLAGFIK